MVLVLFVITLLLLINPVSKVLIADVEKKVDVSVYFKEDASQENILEARSQIIKMPEVKNVEYISREEALEDFMQKHKNDTTLVSSLTEIGYNPFLGSLNIVAKESSSYEKIASFLQMGSFKDLIEKVDYSQRKPVIEKVFAFTAGARNAGVVFAVVFGIISVVIAFNAIKIAIHNSREEISIMRLVGASNWFVRGPFMVQGIIIGLLAAIIAFSLGLAFCYGVDSKISYVIPDLSIFRIFMSGWATLLLAEVASGVGLGIFSSLIAVRKYLKI
jgi:cell division transport system permease protein